MAICLVCHRDCPPARISVDGLCPACAAKRAAEAQDGVAQPPIVEHAQARAREEPEQECVVCEARKHGDAGRLYTPREIVEDFLVDPGDLDETMKLRRAAVASVAASVIKFDNPPGGADRPVNWICNACQKRYFSRSVLGPKREREGRLAVYDFDASPSSPRPKSGCFIATACYGSVNAREVVELRRFRDRVVLTSPGWRQAARLYALLSPPLAASLRRSPWGRRFVRRCILGPIVKVVRRAESKLPNRSGWRP